MPLVLDAIVIGGGPAGGATALGLARAGWSVAVVEKTPFPRRKVCGEFVSATTFQIWERLGVWEELSQRAGPPVRRVGLFARDVAVTADMPQLGLPGRDWGRAVSREILDAVLVRQAATAGAQLWQPWDVVKIERVTDHFLCDLVQRESLRQAQLRAQVIIAAHGSWQPGPMNPHGDGMASRDSDLLAFKAHFRASTLPEDLMPMLAFPGGYGGMVHTSDQRVTLSCCIRRDALGHCRRRRGAVTAADAVFEHIGHECAAAAEILNHATRDGPWLSAGPIRPGIRVPYRDGIFYVGNAAGEAHPVVAEGISMAMQGAGLLVDCLTSPGPTAMCREGLDVLGFRYATCWRRAFSARIAVANFVARLAMQPSAVRLLLPWVRRFPAALSIGARLSGKTKLTESVSPA